VRKSVRSEWPRRRRRRHANKGGRRALHAKHAPYQTCGDVASDPLLAVDLSRAAQPHQRRSTAWHGMAWLCLEPSDRCACRMPCNTRSKARTRTRRAFIQGTNVDGEADADEQSQSEEDAYAATSAPELRRHVRYDESVPHGDLLLPTHQDPKLWHVNVKPGKERVVAARLMQVCTSLGTLQALYIQLKLLNN